ncbi:MAG TPA: ABC transporter ATP-binding protein, partial [Woeseiaceae bacterium]
AFFDGADLLSLEQKAMRRVRGDRIAMIPQDPMGALNPLFAVGAQVEEAIVAHGRARGTKPREQALELLASVRLDDPETRARQYPHEMSGGMRQRVVGAIAMAGSPDLLIADEPTTALDVTVQSQYLDMLRDLQRSRGLSILFITHDLGVVATLCDRVIVMYAGRKVEEAPVTDLFAAPRHWYTRALLDSVPPLLEDRDELAAIPGLPPRPGTIPAGCRFAPRCPNGTAQCRLEEPALTEAGESAHFRCWFPLPAGAGDG